MNKIEASLIKMLMRISTQTFVSSILEFSLSHTLGHFEFLGALLEECGILGVLE